MDETPKTPEQPETPAQPDVAELAAEDVSTPSVAPPDPVPPRRGSVVLPIVGGVVAAVIGFGAAQVYPSLIPNADVAALKTAFAAQTAETKALQDKVALLSADANKPADIGLSDRITSVETSLAAMASPADTSTLAARIDALDAKLAALPAASARATDPADIARLQAEIDALKTNGMPATVLDEAKAELDSKVSELDTRLAGIKADAEAVAKATVNRAALRQIQAALDSGGPYTSALADLANVDLPPVLADNADSGLPSLQVLRDSFPLAARASIDAALRADMGETWTARLGAFLRGQTGARSLSPREGTDPDAVLSRAEAKLAAGDLPGALDEIAVLSPAGQAEMADWVAKAKLRLAAQAAVHDLLSTSGQ
ncbi:MAG: hypothetical protein ABI832_14600 [bacterium]